MVSLYVFVRWRVEMKMEINEMLIEIDISIVHLFHFDYQRIEFSKMRKATKSSLEPLHFFAPGNI